MAKRSDCTTKILVALVIGLIVGGAFMVVVQNKFFKHRNSQLQVFTDFSSVEQIS